MRINYLNLCIGIFLYRKIQYMKKITAMVESAPTKRDAMEILEAMRLVGNITDAEYQKGRELIRKEFSQN